MLSTLRQFLDLLLRRAGPSDLPASPRLLAGTFAALLAVQGALASLLGESPAGMLPRALVSGALLLGWIWFLTRAYGHPARFLQTATAFLGVTLLTTPVLIPLAASVLGAGAGATPPDIKFSLPLLLFVAAAFYLLVIESRILADAIEQPVFLCALLVLAGEFLIGAIALLIGLVPPTPGAAAAPA
jgi:hypothetical protein